MRVPRRAISGVATLAVLGVGYAGYAAAADGTSYRTARATVGDLRETLDLSGTVEPAGRADLAFATSGTVATVKVEAGDTVRAGQTLGTLDAATLRKALQQARAALASAKAQLESDEAAQTDSVSEATGGTPIGQSSQGTPGGGAPQSPQSPGAQSPGAQSPAAPTSPTGPSDSPSHGSQSPDGDDGGQDNSALLAQLKAQQQAVTTAQSTVSASLAAADQALAAQQAACADVTSQACSDALVAVQAAQQQVSADQQALQDALDALGATLSSALTSTSADPAAARTSSRGSGIVLVAATSGTGDFGGSGGASGGTVTAATLAQDQAAIDQARADLVAAEQQLATATVTAPFAGRIVAVDTTVGESVAAGTEAFVLVSQGTTTVQVAATSTQVQELEVGQQASVTPVGADQVLAGTVTQISSVPDDDSTYAVTVTLRRKHLDIATGLTASVAVVTGTAEGVVTVPASAVSDGTVQVLEDGVATRTPVTTGVTGSTRVEITDGLAKGDEVVLADLDAAVPTGDSDSQTFRFGSGGGPSGSFVTPPGGGFPGGGRP